MPPGQAKQSCREEGVGEEGQGPGKRRQWTPREDLQRDNSEQQRGNNSDHSYPGRHAPRDADEGKRGRPEANAGAKDGSTIHEVHCDGGKNQRFAGNEDQKARCHNVESSPKAVKREQCRRDNEGNAVNAPKKSTQRSGTASR